MSDLFSCIFLLLRNLTIGGTERHFFFLFGDRDRGRREYEQTGRVLEIPHELTAMESIDIDTILRSSSLQGFRVKHTNSSLKPRQLTRSQLPVPGSPHDAKSMPSAISLRFKKSQGERFICPDFGVRTHCNYEGVSHRDVADRALTEFCDITYFHSCEGLGCAIQQGSIYRLVSLISSHQDYGLQLE